MSRLYPQISFFWEFWENSPGVIRVKESGGIAAVRRHWCLWSKALPMAYNFSNKEELLSWDSSHSRHHFCHPSSSCPISDLLWLTMTIKVQGILGSLSLPYWNYLYKSTPSICPGQLIVDNDYETVFLWGKWVFQTLVFTKMVNMTDSCSLWALSLEARLSELGRGKQAATTHITFSSTCWFAGDAIALLWRSMFRSSVI